MGGEQIMSEHSRMEFYAYISTLAAIVALVVVAVWAASNGKSIEAIGVGGAVTGLIGVIRMPRGPQHVMANISDGGDISTDAPKTESL
jgi:hypothetical protein